MKLETEIERLRDSLSRAEYIQTELDRRVFHLKTLYDVSKDIFSSVDPEAILRIFLMMTMGNFGVMKGFVLVSNVHYPETKSFISIGLDDADSLAIHQACKEYSAKKLSETAHEGITNPALLEFLPTSIGFAFPLEVDADCCGLLGLGHKLTGEPFNEDDKELISTLLNNLVVALKNARSFKEIRQLNEDLYARNIALEAALNKLKSALRKVEILESVKTNLSKFVPVTVCRLIENFPTQNVLENRDQDVSVLFLDIEGYTKMCERLGGKELNQIIEKYFSVVMDAIYVNQGDVNETAGDGLMVLFLNEDEQTNALQAVRTAVSIKERISSMGSSIKELPENLTINIGISSGPALVGAAKFESYTGSRWTYTARGIVTNIAARLGSLASGGRIMLSKSTADRVVGHFQLTQMGKFKLKNVSTEIEVFAI